MKKILIVLTIAISCLGIRSVSANTYQYDSHLFEEYNCNFEYLDYDYYKDFYMDSSDGSIVSVQSILIQSYEMLMDEYNANFSSEYPFYIIDVFAYDENNCNYTDTITNKLGRIGLSLTLFKEIPTNIYGTIEADYPQHINVNYTSSGFHLDYSGSNSSYYSFFSDNSSIYYDNFFISNFTITNNTDDTFIVSGHKSFILNPGDVLKPYYTADKAFQIDYAEINLNDYAYVILSLKNYEVKPFKTSIQVKGQFCPTPVYYLGTHSSEEAFGSPVKSICSPYYDTYTSYSLSYGSTYLENFAMIYVKAYDTSKDNYIKVDNRIFDITYVSEEEKDSPLVHYQGNTIQTIPYDKLPSTSTLNTEIGYVPDYGNSFSFGDIFTQPLKFLTGIWSTIVTFFSLITSFIALMPPELRGFLFASFTLGIALGLIKILL